MKLAKTPRWLRRRYGRAIRRRPELWAKFKVALRYRPMVSSRREYLSHIRRFTLARIVK